MSLTKKIIRDLRKARRSKQYSCDICEKRYNKEELFELHDELLCEECLNEIERIGKHIVKDFSIDDDAYQILVRDSKFISWQSYSSILNEVTKKLIDNEDYDIIEFCLDFHNSDELVKRLNKDLK